MRVCDIQESSQYNPTTPHNLDSHLHSWDHASPYYLEALKTSLNHFFVIFRAVFHVSTQTHYAQIFY